MKDNNKVQIKGRTTPDPSFLLSPEDEAGILGGVNTKNSVFDYTEAGVKLFSADNGPEEYFYSGRQVSRASADAIVKFFISHGRRPTLDEIPV